jgi:glycerol-3-phosphate dehydrogenase
MGAPWTDSRPLIDGELADAPSFEQAFDRFVEGAISVKRGLPPDLIRVLARRHGTSLHDLLDKVRNVADLGRHFGGFLYEVEAHYLIREEWAAVPDDILWRRTKEGLHMSEDERAAFAEWMSALAPSFT